MAIILEGIVTTVNADGTTNVSPMGAAAVPPMSSFLLGAFQTSMTFRNLKRTGIGVFHVTDDVELLAQAAIGTPDPFPRCIELKQWLAETPSPESQLSDVESSARILIDACRWYAFRVESLDDREERASILAHQFASGTLRDFFGFNRAKHAVVEAAILATRTAILSARHIRAEFKRLAIPVKKTGGDAEHRAFDFLQRYVESQIAGSV